MCNESSKFASFSPVFKLSSETQNVTNPSISHPVKLIRLKPISGTASGKSGVDISTEVNPVATVLSSLTLAFLLPGNRLREPYPLFAESLP